VSIEVGYMHRILAREANHRVCRRWEIAHDSIRLCFALGTLLNPR
jgi:hypothetical protein